jgi:septal ring factor EnvC (AmiA/AmiB activator)
MHDAAAPMKHRTLMVIVIGLAVSLGLCIGRPTADAGPGPSTLKREISRKKEKIEAEKDRLVSLSKREKQLYDDLARVEKRISSLQQELRREKQILQEARQRQDRLKGKKQKLEQAFAANRKDLLQFLEHLWPLHLRHSNVSLADFESWEEADRRFTWLASIYRLAEDKGRKLAKQQRSIQDLLAKQKRLRSELKRQVASIQTKKERLLEDKLRFLHEVQKIRARRMLKEEQLARVKKTIEDLEYKLKIRTTHQIDKLKGYLPYPVKGDIVVHYNAGADPPHEGVGFSLPSKAPVQAVSWGKVVYNDMLRGFGQVVILYHGQQYYTLYAYLAGSSVKVGQDVEKGETIGKAGFYPKAQTSGLYFELRYGKKTLDPESWFKASG